jgi:hypothetical protein
MGKQPERSRDNDDRVTQPQDEPNKVHGDKLDPIIPRGADQKADDSEDVAETEENPMTGDRGKAAR